MSIKNGDTCIKLLADPRYTVGTPRTSLNRHYFEYQLQGVYVRGGSKEAVTEGSRIKNMFSLEMHC